MSIGITLEQQKVIDRFVEFSQKDPSLLEQILARERGNPKFSFLFGGEGAEYYRWRKDNGTAPFPLPASISLNTPNPTASAPSHTAIPALSSEEKQALEIVLFSLNGTKESIKCTKDWILERLHLSRAITAMIAEKVNEADSAKKLHILFVINDVLHHSIKFRTGGALDEFSKSIIPLAAFLMRNICASHPEHKDRVTQILRLWGQRAIFDPVILTQLEEQAMGVPLRLPQQLPPQQAQRIQPPYAQAPHAQQVPHPQQVQTPYQQPQHIPYQQQPAQAPYQQIPPQQAPYQQAQHAPYQQPPQAQPYSPGHPMGSQHGQVPQQRPFPTMPQQPQHMPPQIMQQVPLPQQHLHQPPHQPPLQPFTHFPAQPQPLQQHPNQTAMTQPTPFQEKAHSLPTHNHPPESIRPQVPLPMPTPQIPPSRSMAHTIPPKATPASAERVNIPFETIFQYLKTTQSKEQGTAEPPYTPISVEKLKQLDSSKGQQTLSESYLQGRAREFYNYMERVERAQGQRRSLSRPPRIDPVPVRGVPKRGRGDAHFTDSMRNDTDSMDLSGIQEVEAYAPLGGATNAADPFEAFRKNQSSTYKVALAARIVTPDTVGGTMCYKCGQSGHIARECSLSG